MKYVMFDWPGQGSIPIVFPDSVDHCDIKKMVTSVYSGVKATSAGRIEQIDGRFECFGRSVTLNLEPDKLDEIWINSLLKER